MYEEIFEAWKREKNSRVIQPLASEFLEKASRYLTDLKLLTIKQRKGENLDPAGKREAEYAEFMLSGLLKMRIQKIALMSLEGSIEIPANLTEKEKSLFTNLRTDLDKYRHESLLSSKTSDESIGKNENRSISSNATGEGSSNMLLRILQPIPRLVGVDLQEYGPFQKEDLVTLPRENALVLIARGVASEVKPARIE